MEKGSPRADNEYKIVQIVVYGLSTSNGATLQNTPRRDE